MKFVDGYFIDDSTRLLIRSQKIAGFYGLNPSLHGTTVRAGTDPIELLVNPITEANAAVI